ncbi:MAG: hypothetical protein BWY75_00579 [bacterium ADurb.Bin425]|nr:MAG: hypothetical protein BWY75_00579 [bacterium ADurb.Bin425]
MGENLGRLVIVIDMHDRFAGLDRIFKITPHLIKLVMLLEIHAHKKRALSDKIGSGTITEGIKSRAIKTFFGLTKLMTG